MSKNLKDRVYLKDLGLDGIIILKLIFKGIKYNGVKWIHHVLDGNRDRLL
jgi:hypothetical protein